MYTMTVIAGTPKNVTVTDGSGKCKTQRVQASRSSRDKTGADTGNSGVGATQRGGSAVRSSVRGGLPLCRHGNHAGRWIQSSAPQLRPRCRPGDRPAGPGQGQGQGQGPAGSISGETSLPWFEASGDPCTIQGPPASEVDRHAHWFYAPYQVIAAHPGQYAFSSP
jgi:hypothetical protein